VPAYEIDGEERHLMTKKFFAFLVTVLCLFSGLMAFSSLMVIRNYDEIPSVHELYLTQGKITEFPFSGRSTTPLRIDGAYKLFCADGPCNTCQMTKNCTRATEFYPKKMFGSHAEVWWYRRNKGDISGAIYQLKVDGKLIFSYADAVDYYRNYLSEMFLSFYLSIALMLFFGLVALFCAKRQKLNGF
jgi:hypothetical protein